jgi:isopropylmalate/homocitrate/citramalate synthase
MASVADDLRRATQQKILELSLEDRLNLIARLAEADVDLYCAAHGVSREEAKRVFVRQRRAGRSPSRVMDGASE